MENVAPTKANLMNVKSSLEFSQNGFELLDKKRNVLIREMMSYVGRAQELQGRINTTFSEAYEALMHANATMGVQNVNGISMAIPEAQDFSILFKSVMGVEVPHVNYEKKPVEPTYGFYASSSAMDEAFEKFNEVKFLIYELAEVENAVFKLAIEVKKTQKRANALENIQIPKFKELVKTIGEVLEEKDREDFFRLKVVKKKKAKG